MQSNVNVANLSVLRSYSIVIGGRGRVFRSVVPCNKLLSGMGVRQLATTKCLCKTSTRASDECVLSLQQEITSDTSQSHSGFSADALYIRTRCTFLLGLEICPADVAW